MGITQLATTTLILAITAATGIAGTWRGTLNINGQSLRLVYKVTDSGGGNYSVTSDSLDQNVMGIPVQDVSYANGNLRLQLRTVGALDHGRIDAGGATVTGEFQQGGVLPLVLKRSSAKAGSLVGDWDGTLNFNGQSLRLVFHVTDAGGGKLSGTVDSPDQGANGIPLHEIDLTSRRVWIRAKTIGGVCTGKLQLDGTEITGDWWQGLSVPLKLQKAPRADQRVSWGISRHQMR